MTLRRRFVFQRQRIWRCHPFRAGFWRKVSIGRVPTGWWNLPHNTAVSRLRANLSERLGPDNVADSKRGAHGKGNEPQQAEIIEKIEGGETAGRGTALGCTRRCRRWRHPRLRQFMEAAFAGHCCIRARQGDPTQTGGGESAIAGTSGNARAAGSGRLSPDATRHSRAATSSPQRTATTSRANRRGLQHRVRILRRRNAPQLRRRWWRLLASGRQDPDSGYRCAAGEQTRMRAGAAAWSACKGPAAEAAQRRAGRDRRHRRRR